MSKKTDKLTVSYRPTAGLRRLDFKLFVQGHYKNDVGTCSIKPIYPVNYVALRDGHRFVIMIGKRLLPKSIVVESVIRPRAKFYMRFNTVNCMPWLR